MKMFCYIVVGFGCVMGKFGDYKSDGSNSSVWVFFVCMVLYVFFFKFYKKFGIIIFLFYSWENKYGKVLLIVRVCIVYER